MKLLQKVLWLVFVISLLLLPTLSQAQDEADTVRFATFNASLNRSAAGELLMALSTPDDPQIQAVAEIIQRTRPDVLLVNEFDYDETGEAVRLFQENYLNLAQGDAEAITYPYSYIAPSNTGILSEFDFDNNGAVEVGNDSYGFGLFDGQYGMVVYSMFPIDTESVRTFQNFLWKDMPDALLPDDPATEAPADWYSEEELAVFRLSSKSHWDVPIDVNGTTIHFLVSHPTPPTFDGEEDRNGTRNHDEIRFWADYIANADYIYDDAGVTGGLAEGELFVIAGDENADPSDGDSTDDAILQLLDNPQINTSVTPSSEGGVEQTEVTGMMNAEHEGDPQYDTAAFNPENPGHLRADYVLPSVDLEIVDAGVFWPLMDDPHFAPVGTFPFPSSDHRLVWVDLTLPAAE